ncbi:MAG: HlyC/CorC family transporter [Anaerolineae bacterium]|nr:HlyC/CorC family transporter [Anaerolineae bacterium]
MFKLSLLISLFVPLIAFSVDPGELPGLGFLIIPTIVIIVLILLNGLFVMAEFALIGVRPSQIEELADKGHGVARRVLETLRSPGKQNDYVATAQLGITLASIGLGMYGEKQISYFVESYLAWLLGLDLHDTVVTTTGYLLALGLLTYLHIVVGEMVPKSLALASPRRSVLGIAAPMRLAGVIFKVPVRILNGAGQMLLRLLGLESEDPHARFHSSEEIRLIVAESAEEGAIAEEEKEIIHNIFAFSEREVHQVMSPRNKMEAVPVDMPLPELLTHMSQSPYSRLPVYKNSVDNIIGIIHLKDLVHHRLKAKGEFDIRLLLRPVPVVPESYSVEKLFVLFKRQRTHMAIVLNEFGGTAGLVTLEDLIEEVVGEVQDEFDEEHPPLVEVEPGVLEVAGQYLIDDLADYVYFDPDNLPDVETVGGLIVTKLGRLPRVKDRVDYGDGVQLTVLEVEGRAVTRARITFQS